MLYRKNVTDLMKSTSRSLDSTQFVVRVGLFSSLNIGTSVQTYSANDGQHTFDLHAQ